MARWALLAGLCTVMATQVVSGQRIIPGQRVRVTLSSDSVATGILDTVSQDRIWLREPGGTSAPIAIERVRLLKLHHGRKAELAKGLGFGALGGAVLGGALWLAFISGDNEEEDVETVFAAILIGSGTVGGALAGLGLSVVLARDRWEAVPRDRWAVGPPTWQLGLRLVP